ncbi:hypothetical protein BCR36DRAFT_275866, partial [Piromyces finnis]
GICELNNLKIFANPNSYFLEPVIENYSGTIQFSFDKIDIIINECHSNQIKMVDKYGIQYCETPKCQDNCPVGISANCIPYTYEFINNRTLNICECNDGWEGESCNSKVFIDFK